MNNSSAEGALSLAAKQLKKGNIAKVQKHLSRLKQYSGIEIKLTKHRWRWYLQYGAQA